MDLVIKILGYVNTIAWIFAVFAALKFKSVFKGHNEGWTLVAIGSLFVVCRQIIKLLPFYEFEAGYISRYVIGGIGAAFLFIGFLKLYIKTKELFEN